MVMIVTEVGTSGVHGWRLALSKWPIKSFLPFPLAPVDVGIYEFLKVWFSSLGRWTVQENSVYSFSTNSVLCNSAEFKICFRNYFEKDAT
jgi:hypothetical protein